MTGIEYKYLREVGHCLPSEYVNIVTIDKIEPAQNSDNLEIIKFKEIAYQAMSVIGEFNEGDNVVFIPGDTVLPFEMTEDLGITRYTEKGRVRTVKLRGNRSEGLIVRKAIYEKYKDGILKWENPPRLSNGVKIGRGGQVPEKEIPEAFKKFYKMPNLRNHPYTFRKNETIYISEKVHGMNARFGYLRRPSMGKFWDWLYSLLFAITGMERFDKMQHYVGSHNTVRREIKGRPSGIFWNIYNKYLRNKLPKGYVFYGEVYGPGVQKGFHYGQEEPNVVLFAAVDTNTMNYLAPRDFIQLCRDHDLPILGYEITKYDGISNLLPLSEQPSSFTDEHIREGIVVVSADNGHCMAKLINFNYLEKSDDERTEYH